MASKGKAAGTLGPRCGGRRHGSRVFRAALEAVNPLNRIRPKNSRADSGSWNEHPEISVLGARNFSCDDGAKGAPKYPPVVRPLARSRISAISREGPFSAPAQWVCDRHNYQGSLRALSARRKRGSARTVANRKSRRSCAQLNSAAPRLCVESALPHDAAPAMSALSSIDTASA